MKNCTDHEIEWDLDTIEIRVGEVGEDILDEGIEFEGQCIKCDQNFLKTYLEPVYTLLKGKERLMENTWDYKIASEKFTHNRRKKN